MEVKTAAPVLGIIGLAFAAAGLVMYSLVAVPSWVVTVCELIALGCGGVYLSLRLQELKSFSTRRSTKLGVNSVLLAVLFVSILGIVNFLGARHSQRWDLSETQSFSLAPQTHKVLRNLKQDVSVTVFAQDRSPGFNTYRDLLDSYRSESDHVRVTYVDPERRPDEARKYGITRLNTAVLESGTETVRVTTPSEAELTSGLIRVTRQTKKKILFLDGHGEHSVNDRERGGYEVIKEALTKQGYEVGSLTLLQETGVPQEAAALIVGVRNDASPRQRRPDSRNTLIGEDDYC